MEKSGITILGADYERSLLVLDTYKVSPGVTREQQLVIEAFVDNELPVVFEEFVQSGLRVVAGPPGTRSMGLDRDVFDDRV